MSAQFISEGDGSPGWIKFQTERVKIFVYFIVSILASVQVGTQKGPCMISIDATLFKIAYFASNYDKSHSANLIFTESY